MMAARGNNIGYMIIVGAAGTFDQAPPCQIPPSATESLVTIRTRGYLIAPGPGRNFDAARSIQSKSKVHPLIERRGYGRPEVWRTKSRAAQPHPPTFVLKVNGP